MRTAARPGGELHRLNALYEFQILDTPSDPGFDRLTALASDLFDVPIALISLVDEHRQWFKSHHGLGPRETSRDISFCAHAVANDRTLVVEDALQDHRFCDNPLVTAPPHIRFYAGQLLRPDGRHALGTLCLLDPRPRTFSADDQRRLSLLASQAEELLREHQLRVQLFEQKRVLASTSQRLAALLRAIPDALYVVDASGGVARLDGDLPVSEAFADALRKQRAPSDRASDVRTFSWQEADVIFEVRLLPTQDGEHLAIARDVTERRQVERMKAEFVSTVSHELRTPLTAIRGALGMLAQGMAGALPGDARSLVTVADRNGERLARLIDDILDMEKLEAGQLVMQPRRVSLFELVQQAIADNAPFAESFSVELALAGPLPEAERISVDPERFAQVMANLISNAIKHSPAGGEVTVAVTPDVRAGREGLEVSVVDRGQGIPLAFQPRVFERFAQADGSDRRRTGGTGLGLAITRRLVELMEGEIDFVSVPGEGTRFRVWWPRWQPPFESIKEETP
ncbi:signal transduction histidine kinase [Halomonas campaniensis]|uniref:histidine kinase n=1 Tax=Halomonas campaniensis TaxID=213554 RepID=A0A7W5K362_9GAMM|nr:ATP-binding protein [Halomonas campaniensis]MBB3331096.1 signal transduction histidine kinase [Halomonas campaniensis]